jgi:hypothetical protein
LWISLAACGGGGEDWPEGRPRIDRVALIEQSPGRPLDLWLELFFVDSGKDLAGGRLSLSVDGKEQSDLALGALFSAQSPPVAADAAQGSFDLIVELSPPIAAGQEIELGFRLIDAPGEESNFYRLMLKTLAAAGEGGGA